MDITWDYTNTREYAERIRGGMPPVIITAAVTGEHQKSENPNVPVSPEEQAQAAAEVYAAGASIIHIHGREAHDLTVTSSDAERYRYINELIRKNSPEILIDNSSTHAELPGGSGGALLGAIHYFKGVVSAAPDVMALNPGPMTFRGSRGSPSLIIAGSFDDSLRMANTLRDRGIKPQVFVYHPGHLDILEHLIEHDALDKPYFVQLVFGQQSGIAVGLESVLYMVRNLPGETIFQTCALGLQEIQVNTLAILLGGHVRTGMEDSVYYQRDELAQGNVQFVQRIVRIANDLGRRVATAREARRMLGLAQAT